MHQQLLGQLLNVQRDIDVFFEKAQNGQISEHNSEDESHEDDSDSRGNAASNDDMQRLTRVLDDTGSNRKIPDRLLQCQDLQEMSSERYKVLQSAEGSLVSDFLLSGSVLVGDPANATSRSRSELLTSKDEIQRIRDEVQHFGMFIDQDAPEVAEDGRGGDGELLVSGRRGKEDMLLLDMRFDTSRDLTSVNTSSRKELSSSRQKDGEEDREQEIARHADGDGQPKRKADKPLVEDSKKNDQSAAQIISRNMTTNSFYKQQNFFSDKSNAIVPEEQFTFRLSQQSDTAPRQIQKSSQADGVQNSQALKHSTREDAKQSNADPKVRNEEVNWEKIEINRKSAGTGSQSQVLAGVKHRPREHVLISTTSSQQDTCHDSKTARTQQSQADKASKNQPLSASSLRTCSSMEQKITSLSAAPSKKLDGSKGSKLPPVSTARRLKPIQYLSNKQTYFEKVKQCNRINRQPASSFATTTQSFKSSANTKPDEKKDAAASSAQTPLLQLQNLNSSVSAGDQISSNVLRSVENSASKEKSGPSAELQKFNDIFLDDIKAAQKKEQTKEAPDDVLKDEGVPKYGTFETQREKEDEAGPEPREPATAARKASTDSLTNLPKDQRQLTRRLLKSPEPNLPNYFSLKNADEAARQSDVVANCEKERGGKEMPFDSREATPRLDEEPQKRKSLSSESQRAESLPCPFKKYNREANCLKKTRGGKNRPAMNTEASEGRRAPEEFKFKQKKTIEFLMDQTGQDDREGERTRQKNSASFKSDFVLNTFGREIEHQNKQANDLISQVRKTLKKRPQKLSKSKPKHLAVELAKTESCPNFKQPQSRNKELYSPVPQSNKDWAQQRIRSDCVTPTGQRQPIATNFFAFKAACSCSSKKNLMTSAPEKNRKAILKSRSPAFMTTARKDGLAATVEKAEPTTCPAEQHPDGIFSPMFSVSLKEICDRVQILQDRFMEPKDIIEECRKTIQNQMQVIIALLEQQVKYGIQKVGIQDEITNKKFDLDATMGLLSRLEIQQDKDRRLLGHGHPDLEEPRQICLKYDLIDKERLAWIRKHNQELEEKIQSLETKLRIYKRNEKYQFWGYYDVVADSQVKKRQECNSYDRKKQLDNQYVEHFMMMEFKSPETERKNIFQVSKYPGDQRENIEGATAQSTCLEPLSVSRSQKGVSVLSPHSKSTKALTRQASLQSKVPFAQQLTAKQGAITEQDVNTVNKKLRELQHQIFVKDCQNKELKQQYSELEQRLRKERQSRQVESMEKDLKIQFLQNQIDEVYSVYKKKMKETDPGMKSIKTLGQRLMAEVKDMPELQKKKAANRRNGKQQDNDTLMQLTGKILQKNHDLEQQIFALERQKEELLGLGLTTGAGSMGDNQGAESKQLEQQKKILEMQECIKILSNIFVQQKEAEASNTAQAAAATTTASAADEERQKLKGKAVSSVSKGKELQLHRKKLSRDDPMRKKFVSRDEEDFQKMLQSSVTRSSLSSGRKKKKTDELHKRKESRDMPPQPIPIGQFLNGINPNCQNLVRNDSRNRQKSGRNRQRNAIPQLFNDSDTNLTRNDTMESQDIEHGIAQEQASDLQQAPLADLILPKSKLNSQKNWISKRSPTYRNKAKQEQSDVRIFRQSRKCSNKRAFKYAVYPRNHGSVNNSEQNSRQNSRKPPSKSRELKSSDGSLKRVFGRELNPDKQSLQLPQKQLIKTGSVLSDSQVRAAGAVSARLAGVSSAADLKTKPGEANCQSHQMRSYNMLKDAEYFSRGALDDFSRNGSGEGQQLQSQQPKNRVSSQQMNKLRYLFQ